MDNFTSGSARFLQLFIMNHETKAPLSLDAVRVLLRCRICSQRLEPADPQRSACEEAPNAPTAAENKAAAWWSVHLSRVGVGGSDSHGLISGTGAKQGARHQYCRHNVLTQRSHQRAQHVFVEQTVSVMKHKAFHTERVSSI